MTEELPAGVAELIARSNRLGSDATVTNYGGGNTSAKVTQVNPATGTETELLYVKGSGGDLGTLKATGLAVLERDRLLGLDAVYRGVEHEDEMVGLFPFCSFGTGGATPSIDTPMHGLVDFDHVDHLHPDSVIALACAADGEELVQKIWGGTVGWVPWKRPGWELGKAMRELSAQPGVIGAVLGGHGLTAWGETSDEVEARSLQIIRQAQEYLDAQSVAEPFGPVVAGHEALDPAARRARAAELFPHLRGIASADRRQVGHFTDSDVVLDFLSREKLPQLVALGTSCPDHFLRTKVRPLLLDTAVDAPIDEVAARLAELHAEYRTEYQAYYDRHATPESPAIRGADPAIVLVPGVGMFSFGADKQTARVAGEFYVNAINVMRGAEGVSRYAPVSEADKFDVEYWQLEEDKLKRRPAPKALAGRIALVTGGASGIGLATVQVLAEHGANVIIADVNADGAEKVAEELGGPDKAVAVAINVTDFDQVKAGIAAGVVAFGGIDLIVNNAGITRAGSVTDTTLEDWDLQYSIMPRGSFLVTKAAEAALKAQGLGGDIINICSKNSVFAGPNNIAYSSAKAAQAHMVRLLAAELGEYGVRVNGINPDGVVRGSGIFSGGWGASRAKTYGVAEEDLGKYYAQRTVLKEEVLPEHIALAVLALTNGTLPITTGLLVPVDSGVPQAFMR
ncbi:bifunctional rhamnulose-1-phosphate aldolase/short-chain dehydrogenase [Nakamurella sp. YIM 132087]|uniref:Bifunctional rhamnulose-1-phosphate aldolase/short-chain dehydrogenase n=1 Tax=Nakamurella alba TaxID=2665158 RepID=A0A7K1FMX2_9ACTN|nr:bifunctional rhamnulose-1-phosphate aldolase/short-chain dehydrogenase [Nakamurella alba]MTD15517.1 bifunctional rhamnulose-1-phosphate aldolase/short-chain dehydrogenase [Nakamurella alba]